MDLTPYLERYRGGEWRDRIFRDMILEDVRRDHRPLTVLDIGCGGGFDGSQPLQKSMAEAAGTFLGVEPDKTISPASFFTTVYRTQFEEAGIQPGTVHAAYSVMLLEHICNPQRFFDKLWEVLAVGGVFWGMTVDSRHWFCTASLTAERFRLKELYLTLLLGRRGTGRRYDNYPVVYRSNSPEQIAPLVRRFSQAEFHNFSRVGQCNAYFPKLLHPLLSGWDRRAIRRNQPGTLLIVRLEK